MNSIEASRLFDSSLNVGELSIGDSTEIAIDFSNVKNIDLNDITILLNLQKIAILNKKKIKIENVTPDVLQVLEITGLYKTFSNIMTNPILISKRMSVPSWK